MTETIHENLIVNTEAIDAMNEGEEIPDEIEVGGEIIRIEWKAEGYRGFYDSIPSVTSAWEQIDEGWVTGDYDDAPEDARSSNVEAKLNKLAADLDAEGYDCAAVFMPTSNVFSTGYDVYKRVR